MAEQKPRKFRVKDPGQAAVYFQATGQYEVPNPSVTYDADHYMVQEAPWLFSEEGRAAEPERRDAVAIETATRRPGEKRGGNPSRRPVIPRNVPEGMGVRPDGAIRPAELDQ